MITLSEEQKRKLIALDRLFDSLSATELENLAESEHVIAKLKGTNTDTKFFQNLVNQSNSTYTDAFILKADIVQIKSDFSDLIKVVTSPFDYNAHAKLNTLKSKYNAC